MPCEVRHHGDEGSMAAAEVPLGRPVRGRAAVALAHRPHSLTGMGPRLEKHPTRVKRQDLRGHNLLELFMVQLALW